MTSTSLGTHKSDISVNHDLFSKLFEFRRRALHLRNPHSHILWPPSTQRKKEEPKMNSASIVGFQQHRIHFPTSRWADLHQQKSAHPDSGR
ncbi:hypothetical protein CEXT_612821 [Caerostris extrusa]|uniref:Uncharacterized protein n=1 Tax=Caerostris extrusa TaxID=172846 RepID=A0AAV4PEZ2_CAEEX|nr:hypothetical protein CEXT_612821 [Caerostris extrusa]